MLIQPSTSNQGQMMARPILVADSVRPAAPPRAIEPTTAVSKERSRAEIKHPQDPALPPPQRQPQRAALPSVEVAPSAQRLAKQVKQAQEAEQPAQHAATTAPTKAQAQPDADQSREIAAKSDTQSLISTVTSQPRAEKSEIQKAFESQIKDLLSNVWKASAAAVDFLLGRVTPALSMETALEEALAANRAQFKRPNVELPQPNKASRADLQTMGVTSYNANGSAQNLGLLSAGRLLDVVA